MAFRKVIEAFEVPCEYIDEAFDPKRITVFYDHVNQGDFDSEYRPFLKKLMFCLKNMLGTVEDGLSDNLKAYVEIGELSGVGKVVDVYIYGFREEYSREEFNRLFSVNKDLIKATSGINILGKPFEQIGFPIWSGKINMKGKDVEVGPHVFYRFNESVMG